jgi:hypothetical protein
MEDSLLVPLAETLSASATILLSMPDGTTLDDHEPYICKLGSDHLTAFSKLSKVQSVSMANLKVFA